MVIYLLYVLWIIPGVFSVPAVARTLSFSPAILLLAVVVFDRFHFIRTIVIKMY